MPVFALVFGGLLTALGLVAFLAPQVLGGEKPYQITAAIPAVFGLLIESAGVVAVVAPGARKHAMHLAAAVALLGVVGGFVPAIRSGFDVSKTATQVGLGMTVLSAIFLGLCVRSFVAARRARAASDVA